RAGDIVVGQQRVGVARGVLGTLPVAHVVGVAGRAVGARLHVGADLVLAVPVEGGLLLLGRLRAAGVLLPAGLVLGWRRRALPAAVATAVLVTAAARVRGHDTDDDDPHDGAQRDLALHPHDGSPPECGGPPPLAGRSFAGSIRAELVNRVNTIHEM